ncbi:unnamed protein product [Closterium sp. Naga37s-1]|nr:unnamed protein product [Closterium sp. Naga37s-1]
MARASCRKLATDASTTPRLISHALSPLPALEGTAKLTITGACAVGRCIISGGNAFPIFTSPSSGPTGVILNVHNLNFQRAAGGVFLNVRTRVNASKCGFVSNKGLGSGGGVLSVSYRRFSYCSFYNNTAPIGGGGAISINAGNPEGKGPAMMLEHCYFRNNSAPKGRGGAISVEGTGKIVFKSCRFDKNSAVPSPRSMMGLLLLPRQTMVSLLLLPTPSTFLGLAHPLFHIGPFILPLNHRPCFHTTLPAIHPGVAGGAIYSNGTSLSLAHVTFRNNTAIGIPPATTCGVGGAVYAVSGRYSGASVRFCASSFWDNTGCAAAANTLFLQTVAHPYQWVVGDERLHSQVREKAGWVNGAVWVSWRGSAVEQWEHWGQASWDNGEWVADGKPMHWQVM